MNDCMETVVLTGYSLATCQILLKKLIYLWRYQDPHPRCVRRCKAMLKIIGQIRCQTTANRVAIDMRWFLCKTKELWNITGDPDMALGDVLHEAMKLPTRKARTRKV